MNGSLSSSEKSPQHLVAPAASPNDGQSSHPSSAGPGSKINHSFLGFGWKLDLHESDGCPEWSFLDITRAKELPLTKQEQDWTTATLFELVEHILIIHHDPLREALASLEEAINRLCNRHHDFVHHELRHTFTGFKCDVLTHLNHEETEVFPVSIAVENANRFEHVIGHPAGQITSAIRFMRQGHDEAHAGLRRLVALCASAMARTIDSDLALISRGLTALQADIALHSYKEDAILLPAMIFAEEQLCARNRSHNRGHNCGNSEWR